MAEFSVSNRDSRSVLKISGRFTMEDKARFQECFHQILETEGAFLAVDVSELTYIDSSGIGDLIKIKMEAARGFQRVFLMDVQEAVARVFRVSGLNQIFESISLAEFKAL
jgi:anti-sigma B factor antagonist